MPRTTNGLSAEKLMEFARAGAGQTLKALHAEIIAIERTFPELACRRLVEWCARRSKERRTIRAFKVRGIRAIAAAEKGLEVVDECRHTRRTRLPAHESRVLAIHQ